jgi:hypothetical protein
MAWESQKGSPAEATLCFSERNLEEYVNGSQRPVRIASPFQD